ncbi:ATP-NAD kinase family protein [Thalassotalea marina]|nr:ATP-NAD kinase family protein [Thalassotalea marina]
MPMFKLGLIINPIAGIGGSVALKGSDGEGIAEKAMALGAVAKSNDRAKQALEILKPYQEQITIYTVNNDMGEYTAKALGFNYQIIHQVDQDKTTAQDTEDAVDALLAQNIDLLLFAGGDGTARNVCAKVGDTFPVLGIPAGCKIHSGVYAVTPKAAGRIVELMVTNQLVTLTEADVMDIDESLFREGVVKAKRYGEMQVPAELRYVQAVKAGGKESDELVLQDIAADVINKMEDELYVIGSGSTTAFLMEELGLDNTLLGVDVIQDHALIASDITEPELYNLITEAANGVKLVITLIGGQGHIFGRGNQQLSPRVIRAIGKDNITIIATKTKINALNNRPLIADTGDGELDQELSGYMSITTGYNDQVLYPVSSPE